jgi:hypothetical protein
MMDGNLMSRFAIPRLTDPQRAEMIDVQVLPVGGYADDVAERIAALGASPKRTPPNTKSSSGSFARISRAPAAASAMRGPRPGRLRLEAQ